MLPSLCSLNCGGKRLPRIEKIHGRQITDASLLELGKFLSYCRPKLENPPTIIGGWAVYLYTPKIKSIDIDVVLEKTDMEKISGFFAENNYAKEDEENVYSREVKQQSGKTETMRFDIIDSKTEYAITRDPRVKIPVRLVENHFEERTLQGQKIRIPEKELLLIQKVAAYRNREDTARTGHLKFPLGQREWIERKIAKDKKDIKNLIESGINREKIEQLLRLTRFKQIYQDSLREMRISWQE